MPCQESGRRRDWVDSCPVQPIRTQQIRPHRPRRSREPYDQLVQSDCNRQGASAIFQVDQRGSTYPQGRPTRYESGRGQLSSQSRLRPLHWHGIFQTCQEQEELSTSFFWWRPLIEVEMSNLGNWILVVFDELLYTIVFQPNESDLTLLFVNDYSHVLCRCLS